MAEKLNGKEKTKVKQVEKQLRRIQSMGQKGYKPPREPNQRTNRFK
jgi:hypothetical protein